MRSVNGTHFFVKAIALIRGFILSGSNKRLTALVAILNAAFTFS
jgi:hypothetical protein